MVEKKDRKGGGSKLTRTQTVTVRLDPKLRYLAELAARRHRRTLSSFIEWAIEESLSTVVLYEGSGYNNDHDRSVMDEAESLWDVDEADRFARLAIQYPEMLNIDEQRMWKLVRENGFYWKGLLENEGWVWDQTISNLILPRLRETWDDLQSVVAGEALSEILPIWSEESAIETSSPRGEGFSDDDIPF